MAEAKEQEQVCRFAGLLACSEEQLAATREALAQAYGPIDDLSEILPFTFTRYYEKEMGQNLLRQWVRFERLIDPVALAESKIESNALEATLAKQFGRDPAARPINIDPGYVHRYKVILATTKDNMHRVYLRDGIFAEVTLYWANPHWMKSPWTYADHQTDVAHRFFSRAREATLSRIGSALKR